MKGKTIIDAASEWVNGFNAVPYGMIETLMKADPRRMAGAYQAQLWRPSLCLRRRVCWRMRRNHRGLLR